MKPIMLLFIFILPAFIYMSCVQPDANKQIDEGKIEGNMYHSKEIGWSIEIPEGSEITMKDRILANERETRAVIKRASGVTMDVSKVIHLISFRKDADNVFESTAEPFKDERPGAYEQHNRFVYKLLYDAYLKLGISVDTSSGMETIDGLHFYTFNITAYAPGRKVILNQVLYNRLINGYDFAVSINYNNPFDKEILLRTLQHSKFK